MSRGCMSLNVTCSGTGYQQRKAYLLHFLCVCLATQEHMVVVITTYLYSIISVPETLQRT